jgi:glycosyltransferase involved in cell wall biosynthesis
MQRPTGPAVYASFVVDLLARASDVQLVGGRDAARADLILSLDGRFRAGHGRRSVTAVYDLGYLFERRGYGRLEWLSVNWRVASAARRSDHLLAPSEAVAFGLRRYLRASPGRITVLAATPRACFRRPRREQVEALTRELGLPETYYVYVGSRSRRKNLGLLAEAWAAAMPQLGPGVVLVLAGPGGPGAAVPGTIDLGYVSLERLPELIAGAIAWVSPSLYEGSAVGALEAMAVGTPPIVAGTGAVAHAVGTSGLILDPHDPAQWCRALVAMASSPELRQSLSAGGLRAVAELREPAPQPEALAAELLGEPGAGR